MVFPVLRCDDCQSVMDVVASDALVGNPIDLHYPYIYEHLRGCIRCLRRYEQIVNALLRDRTARSGTEPVNWPSALHRAGWSLMFTQSPPASVPTLHCLILGAHLNAILTEAVLPPGMRAREYWAAGDRLLMADDIPGAPVPTTLQMVLERSGPAGDEVTLIADLSSDEPLRHALSARVSWGSIQASTVVSETGRACFPGISRGLLEPPVPDLVCVFTATLQVKPSN